MRVERLAALFMCLATVIAAGCSLSKDQPAGKAEGQHIAMQLGNVSAVVVEASNLPGRLDIQTGKNGIDFEAVLASQVQGNVERQDQTLTVSANGLEAAPGASSKVVAPAGKELSIILIEVARPLDVVIDYATATQLRASGITAPLSVTVRTRSDLNVVLESGHGSFQLDLPDGVEVRIQGSLNAEQTEALTQLGFVRDGPTWIRTTKSRPMAIVQLHVEGWTGIPMIKTGKAG